MIVGGACILLSASLGQGMKLQTQSELDGRAVATQARVTATVRELQEAAAMVTLLQGQVTALKRTVKRIPTGTALGRQAQVVRFIDTSRGGSEKTCRYGDLVMDKTEYVKLHGADLWEREPGVVNFMQREGLEFHVRVYRNGTSANPEADPTNDSCAILRFVPPQTVQVDQ